MIYVPRELLERCHRAPRELAESAQERPQDATARIPHPGFQSKDSTAKIPHTGSHMQDSKARIPQPRFLNENPTAITQRQRELPQQEIIKKMIFGFWCKGTINQFQYIHIYVYIYIYMQ